ncbi:sterol regulatory element-binding protein 1-like [Petromyzon marinus]|uniref:sterol regulatory element-binding protein 1-like n=1 Tax=Petromyzon marinus TaxID=7757 RepID=UPI003F6FECC2
MGRSILNAHSDAQDDSLSPPPPPAWWWWWCRGAVLALLNAVLALLVLAALLLGGGPVVAPSSAGATLYWRHRRQAEADMARGDFASSGAHLRACLGALGRPLPTSNSDLACGLLLAGLRVLARRLSYSPRGRVGESQQCARDAGLAYHCLHQLYLTGCLRGGRGERPFLCLSALAMAEQAGGTMPSSQRASTFICSAMEAARSASLPGRLAARWLLRCARHVSPRSVWLSSSHAVRFFTRGVWEPASSNLSLFTTTPPGLPVQRFVQALREHLLERSVNAALSLPAAHSATHSATHSRTYTEALQLLQLVIDSSEGDNEGDGERDEVSEWWARVSLLWLLCSRSQAERSLLRLWAQLRAPPVQLTDSRDPLVAAAILLVRARVGVELPARTPPAPPPRGGATPQGPAPRPQGRPGCPAQCLTDCDWAGLALGDSVRAQPTATSVYQAHQLMVADLLMSTRTVAWQQSLAQWDRGVGAQATPTSLLIGYKRDLATMRGLVQSHGVAAHRVRVYEAVLRSASGNGTSGGDGLRRRHAGLIAPDMFPCINEDAASPVR